MEVIILGSANAVPRNGYENTHFLVLSKGQAVLVDCAASTIIQIPKTGVQFDQIDDLILTHFHPDHVAGAPLFLMDLWLLGRRKKMRVHGLAYTLDRFEKMMELFDYCNWPGFFDLEFNRIPENEFEPVLENDALRILCSPVEHLIPNIGIRFESLSSGNSFVYSSDTEPSEKVIRLAQGSSVLFHESSGDAPGHSSAAQAAEIASRAGVQMLYLIHYPAQEEKFAEMLTEARKHFHGKVELARDLMKVTI